jgi:hypothetical protein
MLTEILAHIVIPFAAGLLLLFIIAASDKSPTAWENCNDIALDLTILSTGACGGIFANQTLIRNLDSSAAVYGILIVLCDLIVASILVYVRRWRKLPVSAMSGLRDLFLGLATVGMTAGVLYFGLIPHPIQVPH